MATNDGQAAAGRSEAGAPFTYFNDGLRLAGTLYGTLGPDRLPLVCLPGLTRNSRDFAAFAETIRADDSDRPVVALDFRGRGGSARAPKAADYTLPAETGDVVAACRHLSIERAIFVGTSRGALVVHFLAAEAPELIAGAVLNDAGPQIEAAGLRAIRDAIGKERGFATFDAVADHLEGLYRDSFPALGRADFERMAHATHVALDGRTVADCDPRIAASLSAMDLDADPPALWDLFAKLRPVPLLVIRGETSTLFSKATVETMRDRHPNLAAITAEGQGHAPFLEIAPLPARIARFCDQIESEPPGGS